MIQGLWISVGGDIAPTVAVRQSVFGRGRDALDDQAQQVLVMDADGHAVGTARLWWQDGAFWLGDACVLAAERGKGYGDLLVRLALFKALTHSASRVALRSPREVAPFFAKYGFCEDEGGAQASDPVVMSIRAQDVRLSHCGGDCSQCDHPSEECAPKALR